MKRVLSLIGIGTLALLVAVPANAKTVDKNKAFNDCRREVRDEFNGARPRLKKIRGYGGEWNKKFYVPLISTLARKCLQFCKLGT